MMIIQNASLNQAAQPDGRTSNDAPKFVTHTSSTEPALTVDSPRNTSNQVPPQPPSSEQLKSAVDVINQVLQQSNHSLEFILDSESKTPIVKLVDTETGELIRQFPSETTLAISRSIDQFQKQQGLLLTQKA